MSGILLRRLRAALALCPVLGVDAGVSPTEGSKEDVSAVTTEIVTFSSDGIMSRTVSADAALRAGGVMSGRTGDVLDEEPAVPGADGLRIGIGLGLGLGLGSTGGAGEEPAVAGADGFVSV